MSACEPAGFRRSRPELGTKIRDVRDPGLVSLRDAAASGWTVVAAGRRGTMLRAVCRVPGSAAGSWTPMVTVGVTIVTARATACARSAR